MASVSVMASWMHWRMAAAEADGSLTMCCRLACSASIDCGSGALSGNSGENGSGGKASSVVRICSSIQRKERGWHVLPVSAC